MSADPAGDDVGRFGIRNIGSKIAFAAPVLVIGAVVLVAWLRGWQ